MNVQNIPRHDKVIKRAIVPKLGALSFFDFGQIEPRLTAYFAAKIGLPEFAERIVVGGDSYTALAQMITGKEDLADEERQLWKQTFLSLVYGGGIPAVQRYQEGTTRPQAKAIIEKFHSNFPAVKALQEMTVAVHRRKGYITSLGGRRLHLEPYGEHKLLNKLIQGSAADVMHQALIDVDRFLRTGVTVAPMPLMKGRIPESHMISVVHDEIQIDGPLNELELLHYQLPALMDTFPAVSEIVPIIVEHEVSTTNWAEKIDYDEWKELHADQLAA